MVSGAAHFTGRTIMAISPMATTASAYARNADSSRFASAGAGERPPRPLTAARPATALSSETITASNLYLEYTSKDGDKVSLSFQTMEYQKTLIEGGEGMASADWEKLIDQSRDQMISMQKQILEKVFGAVKEDEKEVSPEDVEQLEALMPEYWSAESTAQRIVDFATSFFDAAKGDGQDFMQRIKSAIEQGFGEARDALGELPGVVSALTEKTYSLVMEKLDSWAKQQGVEEQGLEEQGLEEQIAQGGAV
jgi:hypothetical protein